MNRKLKKEENPKDFPRNVGLNSDRMLSPPHVIIGCISDGICKKILFPRKKKHLELNMSRSRIAVVSGGQKGQNGNASKMVK